MRNYLLTLLQELERLLPPGQVYPQDRHHAITFARYGSDETGWTDELALHLRLGDRVQTIFFDTADFELAPEALAQTIAEKVRQA